MQQYVPRIGKTCTKCGQVKPLDAFVKRGDRNSGRRNRCKECANAVNKEWRDLVLARDGYKQAWRNIACPEGMRACSVCHDIRLISEFKPRNGRCPECRKAFARHHYARNRERLASQHLSRKYALSDEAYAALILCQGGVCAICGTFTPTPQHPRLVVDHDHDTGAVRGLLCHSCNLGLGHFRDDATMLVRALGYLTGVQHAAIA